MDYEDMLDKAHNEVEEIGDKDVRFDIPDPETSFDGSYTTYENFYKSADLMGRDQKELLTFFKDSLATSGSIDGDEAKFKGRFSDTELKECLTNYYEMYVECEQCGSPDTKYENQSGVEVIRCTACGANQPKPS